MDSKQHVTLPMLISFDCCINQSTGFLQAIIHDQTTKIMQIISFSLICKILDKYINTVKSPQVIMCKVLKVIMQILASTLYGVSHRKNFPSWTTTLKNISGLEFTFILFW